ncbi:MAG: hypothetical protein K6G12_05245 [Lachnospiraceae bacterium]|nr:hypothetical protein [Lachnospiraceae bacterium]
MKKTGRTILAAITVAALIMGTLAGCASAITDRPATDEENAIEAGAQGDQADGATGDGQTDSSTADGATSQDESAADGATSQDDSAAGGIESTYEDPDNLPEYSYLGDEEYLDVINEYLISFEKTIAGDDLPDVYIPFSKVVQVDDSDPTDIIAYGAYNICGYDLLNTTLFATTGSWTMGAIHLAKNDDGTYAVTDAELPFVMEECMEVFAPVPGLYDKANDLMNKEGEKMRADSIDEYVSANKLNITQWQDYGNAPIPVAGAETPEEAQLYTYRSPLGYQITYDLRELSQTWLGTDDMFGKVEEEWTGTLMSVKKAVGDNADAALTEVLSNTSAGDVKGEAATVAGIPCVRAVYDEPIEDGRIFRYVCYYVGEKEDALVITTETTVEEGVSDISVDELETYFEPVLSTFSLIDLNEACKDAYRTCLNDILDNKLPLSDGIAATYYSDLGKKAYFATDDLTGDGIPELIVTQCEPDDDYIVSELYQARVDDYGNSMRGFDAYDPDENKIYCNKDLETVIYELVDGKFVFLERYNEYGDDGWYYSDYEAVPDQKISDEKGKAFKETHRSLRAEFKNCFDFKEITKENIESEFGTE